MRSAYLQSTLRELQSFFQSPRFWATILIVGIVFAVVGPFGTANTMPFIRRLAFWLLLHTTAFSIASIVIVFVVSCFDGAGSNRLVVMMVGAAIAALPIGIAVEALQAGFTDKAMSVSSALEQIKISLLLSPLLCALTYLTMRAPPPTPEHGAAEVLYPLDARDTSPHTETSRLPAAISNEPAPPAILLRLKPQNRGPLLRLSVQDHYTEVVTSRGRELILLRFADALNETAPVEGYRIHRSHWVAKDHVAFIRRDKGKLLIVTANGEELPVSRPNEAEIKVLFGNRARS